MTNQSAKPATAGPKALATRVSELKTWSIDWLWPGRIARARLTLIGGPAGSGKSALAMQLVAAVTTGGNWPCQEGNAPQGSVVLVCPHGDPDIIKARLKAAGANLANVHLIHDVEESNGSRPFDVATDLPMLDATIRTLEARTADHRRLPQSSRAEATGQMPARAMFAPLAALAKAARHSGCGDWPGAGLGGFGPQARELQSGCPCPRAVRLRHRDRPSRREAAAPAAGEERARAGCRDLGFPHRAT